MITSTHRRRLLLASAGCASLAALPEAIAQAYPGKPIRWIVPYPAGGGSDFLARTVGAQLSQQLGQPVVIDNRPGAATMIGAEAAAKSPPDGYTLLTGDNGTFVFNSALYRKMPYDPLKDFAPVGLLARFPLILVAHPATPYRSAKELFDDARRRPGQLSYASVGPGSPHHLAFEMLKQRTGTFIVHIPYRGAAPAVQDVLGGQVPMMVIDTAVGLQHIRSGRLRALGVASKARIATLPDVPTLEDQGIRDTEIYAWQGLAVPAATPRDIVTRLSTELPRALGNAEVSKKLVEFGLEPTPGSPEQMAAYMRSEIQRWHALIRERGLVLET